MYTRFLRAVIQYLSIQSQHHLMPISQSHLLFVVGPARSLAYQSAPHETSSCRNGGT